MAMACMTRVVVMAFMAFVVILVIIMLFCMIFMLVVILVAFVITMFFRMVFMLVMIVVVAMIVRMFLMLLVIIVAFVISMTTRFHMHTAIEMFRLTPHKRRAKRRFNGETPLIGKPPLQHHTELPIDGVVLRVPLQIVLKTSMPLDRHHRNGTKLSGRQRLFAAGGTMSTNLLKS